MQTRILQIDEQSLETSKQLILTGSPVAFPTETVYGLGANAFDTEAVERIFEIKGRPSDNPLIVHVHKDYDIGSLVSYIPEYAEKLAVEFLPGPLTMVYKSRNKVSPAVSCGLDTLAVRVPSHEGAQRFLKYVSLPIAAPSANLSKHVSPVTAEHVYADLNGKIEVILDGGKCCGGIESTVLDCTGEIPVVLRSGLITREMIAATVGDCAEYAFKEGDKAVELYKEKNSQGVNAFIMCDESTAKLINVEKTLILGKTEREVAANLYYKLREGEKKAQLIIAIAPQKQDGIMAGVMNRLAKACKKV